MSAISTTRKLARKARRFFERALGTDDENARKRKLKRAAKWHNRVHQKYEQINKAKRRR